MNQALTELVANTLKEASDAVPGGILALSLDFWPVGKLQPEDFIHGYFVGLTLSKPAHIVIGEDDSSNMWRTMHEALESCKPGGIVFLMVFGEWWPDGEGFVQTKHYYSHDRLTHLFAGIKSNP